jgi:hypothetical protein
VAVKHFGVTVAGVNDEGSAPALPTKR